VRNNYELRENIGKLDKKISSKYLSFKVEDITIDNNPADEHLTHLISFYNCLEIKPHTSIDKKVTFSLTSIPPRYKYLKDLQLNSIVTQIIVNIPKTFRYYHSDDLKLDMIDVNMIDNDIGPGQKIIGLCQNINLIKNDVIVYGDDDVVYDLSKIRDMSKFVEDDIILGGHGGFYTGINDQNLSFLGYPYLMLRFKLPVCFINSDVLMGFSGVMLTKNTLKKLCDCPRLLNMKSKKECYFVDDDWLSDSYKKCGMKVISNPEYILSKDVSRSESDGWSNRAKYHNSRKECLSGYEMFGKITPTYITTALITDQESLHKLSEYDGIKSIIRKNHYDFSDKYNIKYELYTKTSLEKSHWSKIEIIDDFLKKCSADQTLFYTDFDFIFISNNFPVFQSGKSWIMNHGCSYDDDMLMVGNIFVKCDKTLLDFTQSWLATTQMAATYGVFNDDQIAFNLIKSDLASRLQIEDFYRYDICEHKEGLVGYHIPGGNKLNRVTKLLNLNNL
jgi:hypothetical protein